MAPPSKSRSTSALTAAATATSLTVGILGALYYLDIPAFLQQRVSTRQVEKRCYSADEKPSLAAFKLLCEQQTLKATYPLAAQIEKNIPIYHAQNFDVLSPASSHNGVSAQKIEQLKDELYHNLTRGPGVYVIKGFFDDTSIIDRTNAAYAEIAERESAAAAANGNGAGKKGDHFAPASANTRIWNSFQKHGEHDPASFLAYYGNPWFQLVCDSYLGPGYRITTQMNTVRPGGQAQMPHRDYHLGFQTDADVVQWPKAVHEFSGKLTLQGAVAHTDMPLASGPTRLLPFSQLFGEGFRSYRTKEFIEYFLDKYVALPLQKGDAVFFSPALFHAAGENVTKDFDRIANLIQVSSAFGKTMETIDSLPLIEATYDGLCELHREEGLSARTDAFIRAVADGYPFPTNLDCRPPAPGGMAPESEQEILRRCVSEGRVKEDAIQELTEMRHASSVNGAVARQTTVFGT